MSDAVLNPVRSLARPRLPVLAQVLTPALLLVRDALSRPPMHPAISRLPAAAGEVPGRRAVLEELAMERWHGVCGQP